MTQAITLFPKSTAHRLSVAPMMDWTDRHCRVFHRMMTRRAMLYTEMVTSAAVIHGPKARLLDFSGAEHPLALQLGGSDPGELAKATAIARDWGYDEVNLNCGCPSDRVQSGCFGAVLMERPALVAECLSAMQSETDALVSHARKAWLKGLSPKENREIPPLDHDLVLRMKARYPELTICLNGGVTSLAQAKSLLDLGLDGVMIGRVAYHDPGAVLIGADALWGHDFALDVFEVAGAMRPYIAAHLAAGGRMHQITRHMLGLFTGRPGARSWRRHLSDGASRAGAGLDPYDLALAEVSREAA